jgi:hypothetical protein
MDDIPKSSAPVHTRLTWLADQAVGLFTEQQAIRLGLDRPQIERAVADRVIERFDETPGMKLFRHLAFEFERRAEGPAAWMQLEPELFSHERGHNLLEQTEILTGGMALELQGFAAPTFRPLFLIHPEAPAPRNPDSFVRHSYASTDWAYVSGVPVARLSMAIADMIMNHDDEDLIRSCLRDAFSDPTFDLPRLIELLAPVAAERGAPSAQALFFDVLGPTVTSRYASGGIVEVQRRSSEIIFTAVFPTTRSAS